MARKQSPEDPVNGSVRQRLLEGAADLFTRRGYVATTVREMVAAARGDGQVWSAGVFLSFPFFDGMRSRGKTAQAKSDLNTLKIEEAKLKDSIALQVRDAGNACREAEEIMKALSGTVRQAERLLRMAEKGYEFGVKTKLEVDDAQLSVIEAKGNLARARRDYSVARVTLDWVMGTLGEKTGQ